MAVLNDPARYQMPERFDLRRRRRNTIIDRVIHRSIFGSFERFIAILTSLRRASAVARAVRRWLRSRSAPGYAATCASLKTAGLRGSRLAHDKIGYKIREATAKVPYMLCRRSEVPRHRLGRTRKGATMLAAGAAVIARRRRDPDESSTAAKRQPLRNVVFIAFDRSLAGTIGTGQRTYPGREYSSSRPPGSSSGSCAAAGAAIASISSRPRRTLATAVPPVSASWLRNTINMSRRAARESRRHRR